ncbi:F-box protein SKIP23 [Quillaja saponaria]|uniref:F-box protein SKIP23 n=1 Tax=Quillaja saponaria TaxID=32244 RepID=A0AAD7PUM3_QUISA|nr:F-box protein SKIP23 [Quillaja saponaria]
MADWSQLPKELLDVIAKRLESPFYVLRFRSVCSSWRSSVTIKLRRLSGRFPFLPNDGISETSWGFYLSKRSIFLIGAPETQLGMNSEPWLVKIEEDSLGRVELLYPLSRFQIKPMPEEFPKVLDISALPIIELGHEYVLHYMNFRPFNSRADAGSLYMEKVVFMYLDFENDDFVLLTIHVSGKLAMFKSGDRRWNIIQEMPSPYDDVIVFKDKFYAVDNTGRAVVVGLSSNVCLVAEPVFGGDKKYLVESNGELLMVDMYLSFSSNQDFDDDFQEEIDGCLCERTVRFTIFKLDGEGKKWIEVESLGDRVLFLADDCTFSSSASELSICKGNCIFFTDNFFFINNEENGVLNGRIGVFDLDDSRITPLVDCPQYSKLFWPPPNWVALTTEGVSINLRVLMFSSEFYCTLSFFS